MDVCVMAVKRGAGSRGEHHRPRLRSFEFGGTRSVREPEVPYYLSNQGGRLGQDRVVEEPDDVTSGDFGGLLGFTNPP